MCLSVAIGAVYVLKPAFRNARLLPGPYQRNGLPVDHGLVVARQQDPARLQAPTIRDLVPKRLKELQAGNARLKRAVADFTLDKLILKEVVEGKY